MTTSKHRDGDPEGSEWERPPETTAEGKAVAWATVQWMSIMLGLLGMAFMAGSNWHRIDGLDSRASTQDIRMNRMEDQIPTIYVRKDVLQGQFESINNQLAEVRAQLQAIRTKQQ